MQILVHLGKAAADSLLVVKHRFLFALSHRKMGRHFRGGNPVSPGLSLDLKGKARDNRHLSRLKDQNRLDRIGGFLRNPELVIAKLAVGSGEEDSAEQNKADRGERPL